MGERGHVGAVIDGGENGGHELAGVLEAVASVELKGTLIHPDDGGFDVVGEVAGRVGGSDEVTAADVELAIEDESDGERRLRLFEVAIPGDDAFDDRGSA